MRVLIDAHLLGQNETGNETYIASLLGQAGLLRSRGVLPHALVSAPQPLTSGVDYWVDPTCARNFHRLRSSIPRALAQIGADLLHVTYHAPFWIDTPYLVMIHDISYRSRPQFTSPRNLLIQNLLGFLTAQRAGGAVTPSRFSQKEIERIYPRLRGRTFITPYAAGGQFKPQAPDDVARVKAALGLAAGDRYFLFVGKPQRRKNVERLVEAFLHAHASHPDVRLVIAGQDDTRSARSLKHKYAAQIRAGHILLAGYLAHSPGRELACLYSGCAAFVFPSLYEGFGIPVLEAMQCGAPVIASNTTSIPEVAGSAALLVNPLDISELAACLLQVLEQPELARNLRALGFERARQFSWEAMADRTADAYFEVLRLASARRNQARG